MNKKVIPATITPLNADGSLDLKGFANILNLNIAQGVDGFFILGSMGEWGCLTEADKETLVATACEVVGKRAEVLVGINATSASLSIKYMEQYKKYDVDSYVFMLPGNTDFSDPLKSVLSVLDSADRPVYYYHIPIVNGKNLTLGEFKTIMAHPNLKGIKNSSSDLKIRRELLEIRDKNNFKTLFFEGQEWAVQDAFMLGLDGTVFGMGSLGSALMVSLARAADEKDWDKAYKLQSKLVDLYHGVYVGTARAGQKYALYKLGIISSPLCLTQDMDKLTDKLKKQIEDCLENMKDDLKINI